MKIILGSSSKWRQQILTEMGYEFEIVTPDIDEKQIRRTDPKELVIALAEAKADAVAAKVSEPALIITSDQVGACNNIIREKPVSTEEVYEFYDQYRQYPLQTFTAVTVRNTATGNQQTDVDIVSTHLAPIPNTIIDELIAEGEILNMAGAIKLEDPRISPFILSRDGALDSLIGLPKDLTLKLIEKMSS